MALLLAMYQKMRLIREKNQATLDLTKFSQKYKRVQDNIERVNKKYTSMLANIDKQAKMMESRATSIFQNMAGLGLNNFSGNFIDPYSFGGTNGFILQKAAEIFKQGYAYQYKEGDETKQGKYTPTVDFNTLLSIYNANGTTIPHLKNDDGTPIYRTDELKLFGVGEDNKTILTYEGFKHEDVMAFKAAMQLAAQQQQAAQFQAQQMNQQFSTNVSIWAEAMKAQIEAEQDEMVAPLNYQETMWELEKTNAEAKLKRIEAELQSYDQLANQEAQKSAPTFGLS